MSTFTRFLKSIFVEDRLVAQLQAEAKVMQAAMNTQVSERDSIKRRLDIATRTLENYEGHIEQMRGQLTSLVEGHEREVIQLKEIVDYFAKLHTGSQVFGTAPAEVQHIPVEEPQTTGSMNSRQMRQAMDELFIEMAQKKVAGESIPAEFPAPEGGKDYLRMANEPFGTDTAAANAAH